MAKKDAEQAVVDLSDAVPAAEFMDLHKDLDLVERQLSRLRRRQEALVDHDHSSSKKGKIEQIDLHALIDLNKIDDEFDRRFEAFAGFDSAEDIPQWVDR